MGGVCLLALFPCLFVWCIFVVWVWWFGCDWQMSVIDADKQESITAHTTVLLVDMVSLSSCLVHLMLNKHFCASNGKSFAAFFSPVSVSSVPGFAEKH